MASPQRAARDLADDHVHRLAALDPIAAGMLGWSEHQDELPDLSPDGVAAGEALRRDTLARLGALPAPTDPDDRRCARLLAERLEAELAHSVSGEPLRSVQEMFGPLVRIVQGFTLMPVGSEADRATIAARMARVPAAVEGYRATLDEGRRRGLLAPARQVERVVGQVRAWMDDDEGRGWFAGFASAFPGDDGAVRADLERGAAAAIEAMASLRAWLVDQYLPATEGTADGVGAERYRIAARYWNGSEIDLDEAYAWAWSEFRRLRAEMNAEAARVLPGASLSEAIAHLEAGGGPGAITGGEAARVHLQGLIDEAVAALDGTHFDLSGPLARIESCLAPVGAAAAPYYSPPAVDFSRPGRTWLPRTPDDRYPVWDLPSIWYHESVPGHHLQLASWTARASELSLFQISEIGLVSANAEGWALYAERLMDDLGFFTDPGTRLGFLCEQMLRAVRVIIDLGMHLSLPIPADSPVGPGQRWTPDLGREMLLRYTAGGAHRVESELVRYLGGPGQAISYKLGERAWLQGRERARAAAGPAFDLRAWHAAALAQGSLGLDDTVTELAALF